MIIALGPLFSQSNRVFEYFPFVCEGGCRYSREKLGSLNVVIFIANRLVNVSNFHDLTEVRRILTYYHIHSVHNASPRLHSIGRFQSGWSHFDRIWEGEYHRRS